MIHFKKLLEQDPNYSPAHAWLASIYAHKRLFDQEADEMETSLKLDGLPDVAAALRRAYTTVRRQRVVLKDIELRSNPANKRLYWALFVAQDYARLGDKDNTFIWLERAWTERAGWAFLKVDPDFDSLRSDPRFADLLRRIGFPQ